VTPIQQEVFISSSLFYSKMQNLISLIQSPTNDGGSMYANTDSAAVRGVSATLDAQFSHQLSMYINYQYIEGKEVNNWQAIDHTARNKWNIGFNWLTFDDNLNISLRTNIIGSRKAPTSNGYYQGYAPGYEKTALTLTWQNWVIGGVHMSPQLVVKNLFDEAYAGVGRQDGRSVASQYDPFTNFNPQGFVPGYHPQTGRTLLFNVKIEF
jgi:outer membrane receptor for ferrienterochelin and colicin